MRARPPPRDRGRGGRDFLVEGLELGIVFAEVLELPEDLFGGDLRGHAAGCHGGLAAEDVGGGVHPGRGLRGWLLHVETRDAGG